MISKKDLQTLLLTELAADRSNDDVTTKLLGTKSGLLCRAVVVAKKPGVFCGKNILECLESLYPKEMTKPKSKEDGDTIVSGEQLLSFTSSIGVALTIERTLLNLVTHLSGIATITRKYVEAVKPFSTKILATRKTLLGMRDLQLMGVVAGGGSVHRRNLSDGILIKDNHMTIEGISSLLTRAKAMHSPLHKIEIEVQNLEQLDEVLSLGVDLVMLDNFGLEILREGVKRIRERAPQGTKIEVSGGITLEQVGAIAELGIDYVSIGALTHSVVALDMSLDLCLVSEK